MPVKLDPLTGSRTYFARGPFSGFALACCGVVLTLVGMVCVVGIVSGGAGYWTSAVLLGVALAGGGAAAVSFALMQQKTVVAPTGVSCSKYRSRRFPIDGISDVWVSPVDGSRAFCIVLTLRTGEQRLLTLMRGRRSAQLLPAAVAAEVAAIRMVLGLPDIGHVDAAVEAALRTDNRSVRGARTRFRRRQALVTVAGWLGIAWLAFAAYTVTAEVSSWSWFAAAAGVLVLVGVGTHIDPRPALWLRALAARAGSSTRSPDLGVAVSELKALYTAAMGQDVALYDSRSELSILQSPELRTDGGLLQLMVLRSAMQQPWVELATPNARLAVVNRACSTPFVFSKLIDSDLALALLDLHDSDTQKNVAARARDHVYWSTQFMPTVIGLTAYLLSRSPSDVMPWELTIDRGAAAYGRYLQPRVRR